MRFDPPSEPDPVGPDPAGLDPAQHAPAERPARRALRDAWSVIAPTQCSGCGAPDRALCAACRLSLTAQVHACQRADQTVWAALDYSGVVRRILGNYKDGGRTDAAAALAVPLRQAIAQALASSALLCVDVPATSLPATSLPVTTVRGGVHLVTIPSTAAAYRTRGYHPVELLLRRAGLVSTPVLDLVTATSDQVGLGRDARALNKTGSLRARHDLASFRCLIVDDILTTGATVLEARRAVCAAGGEVLGFATLAETRRRIPDPRRSSKTG